MSTTRTVTVYATQGQKTAKIETSASTWGELKEIVSEQGYNLETLSATENINRTSLDHADASLPAGDFTLFLRPVKTKSGIDGAEDMGYRELREKIATALEEDGDVAREHFNSHVSGKNYTQLSTPQLREVVGSYVPLSERQSVDIEEEEEVEEVEENAGPVVFTEEQIMEARNAERVRKIKELLNEVCETSDNDDVCDRTSEIDEMLDGVLADLVSEEVTAEMQAELERLAREANELERGFSGR